MPMCSMDTKVKSMHFKHKCQSILSYVHVQYGHKSYINVFLNTNVVRTHIFIIVPDDTRPIMNT